MENKETIEEVAKLNAIYELENNYKPTKESFKLACKRSFIKGANWQAERMYSKQDLIAAYNAENEGWVGFDFWFEQFKKK